MPKHEPPATLDPVVLEMADEIKVIRRILENMTTLPSDPPSEFLTPKEAAAFAKCSTRTLERHHAEGKEVGLRKIGRRTVYHRGTLAQFLASSHPQR